MRDFKYGIKRGVPIALGYLSVSFTYGIKAVHGGIPWWMAVIISLSNLTSAGQFAGTTLILAGGSYVEIAVTTLVINLRYMLMSLALSQKLQRPMSGFHRFLIGYGVTDEIFGVAVSEGRKLSSAYMYGLIFLPVAGWTAGTFLGAVASGIMPPALADAMELGLYAMFLAIIIPPARKNYRIALVIAAAVALECILYYVPVFSFISSGFRIILAAVAAAALGAALFPVEETEWEGGRMTWLKWLSVLPLWQWLLILSGCFPLCCFRGRLNLSFLNPFCIMSPMLFWQRLPFRRSFTPRGTF